MHPCRQVQNKLPKPLKPTNMQTLHRVAPNHHEIGTHNLLTALQCQFMSDYISE